MLKDWLNCFRMLNTWDSFNRVGEKKKKSLSELTSQTSSAPESLLNLSLTWYLHCQGQGWNSPLCWSSPRSQGPLSLGLFACLWPAEASAQLLHWEPHVWSQKPRHQPKGKQRNNSHLCCCFRKNETPTDLLSVSNFCLSQERGSAAACRKSYCAQAGLLIACIYQYIPAIHSCSV